MIVENPVSLCSGQASSYSLVLQGVVCCHEKILLLLLLSHCSLAWSRSAPATDRVSGLVVINNMGLLKLNSNDYNNGIISPPLEPKRQRAKGKEFCNYKNVTYSSLLLLRPSPHSHSHSSTPVAI